VAKKPGPSTPSGAETTFILLPLTAVSIFSELSIIQYPI
jgi:hypothetical protein